ncbi:MAG TPA: hypothetical protein VGH76_21380 [Actinomycetospora sp.]|jgi:hypothetical protein|uniref:hypothetical protein n=1 Tax=Actinomycetospora sp. TaxID=1872135 RepID=UPI002F40A177
MAIRTPSATAIGWPVKHPTAADLVAAGEGVTPTMGSRAMRQWVSVAVEESGDLIAAARRHAV